MREREVVGHAAIPVQELKKLSGKKPKSESESKADKLKRKSDVDLLVMLHATGVAAPEGASLQQLRDLVVKEDVLAKWELLGEDVTPPSSARTC